MVFSNATKRMTQRTGHSDWDGFPREVAVLWTLRRYGRDAVCRLFTHVFGHELRIEVAGLLLSSVVCRSDDDISDYQDGWRNALEHSGWRRLVFLRCRDCVNSVTMSRNLDVALRGLDQPHEYEVLEVDALPQTDSHFGLAAPTLLWDGFDLFDPSGRPSSPGPS